MSFPFRNRPNLKDRFRGKSGDEIMEEMRQSMDENRKKFFESNPKWGGESRPPASSRFPRGFPFDDDDLTSGKFKLKDHLDDLVQRHPELADQLKDWGGIEKRPRHEGPSKAEGTSNKQDKKEEDIGPIGASNLRNTVPDMQHNQAQDESDRGQRSQSAPPEALQRNTTKEPPRNEQQQQQQQQQQPPNNVQHPQQPYNQRAPTVRHIPIHVEGRDEPLLPKEATEATCPPQPQAPPHHHSQVPPHHHSQAPPHHHSQAPPHHHSQAPPHHPQAPPHHHSQVPPQPMRNAKKQAKSQEPIPIPVQLGNAQPHPPHQKSPTPPPQAQAPPPPPPRIDPLDQVAFIQKEIDSLKQKIDGIKSLAKTDREYIYLDEMLTRNLLKLDNIESEGREEVRAARKEAIRRIQECINILESLPDRKPTEQEAKTDTNT